jgi:hypothetical protein
MPECTGFFFTLGTLLETIPIRKWDFITGNLTVTSDLTTSQGIKSGTSTWELLEILHLRHWRVKMSYSLPATLTGANTCTLARWRDTDLFIDTGNSRECCKCLFTSQN